MFLFQLPISGAPYFNLPAGPPSSLAGDDDESLSHEPWRLVPHPRVLWAGRQQDLEVLALELEEVHEVVEGAAGRLGGVGAVGLLEGQDLFGNRGGGSADGSLREMKKVQFSIVQALCINTFGKASLKQYST